MNKKQAIELIACVEDLYAEVSSATHSDPVPDPTPLQQQFTALVAEAEAGLGQPAPFGKLVTSEGTPAVTRLLGLDALIGQLARWIRGETDIKGGSFRIVKDGEGHLKGT